MKKLFFLSLLFLGLFGCREDVDTEFDTTTVTNPPVVIDDYDPTSNLVSGTVSGYIFDEADVPVEGATVRMRGVSYTTDDEGYFLAKDVELDAEGTFFTVEKNGYFDGSRRFYPRANVVSYTRVQLMELNNIGSFASNTAATLTGTDGIKLSFPANGIKKADGTIYNGDVTVAAKWLDPTADNVTELMPGNLFGLNNKVEEVALATYGMMAVELFGENGEELNVADGKKVELSFPLPADMGSTAPDEIPLWSFEDAQYGIWVEEGKATRQGDFYVGEVSHFSFWNCDAPFPIVFVEGRLLTDNGAPIADAVVKVQVASTSICGYGYTDSEGYFSGKLPKGEVLNISAGSDWDLCDFAATQIGPFDADTNIGDITLADSGAAFEVSGTVVDCSGAPVTDGRVKILVGTRLTTIILDGSNSFNVGILNCDAVSDLVIRADNFVSQEGSDPQTIAITPNVDAGEIMACGTAITEFFTFTVNGETHTFNEGSVFFEIPTTNEYLFLSVNDSLSGNPNSQDAFSISLTFGNVGTYGLTDLNSINMNTTMPNYSQTSSFSCWNQQGQSGCNDLTVLEVNITSNEGVGGNLEGNMTGTAIFNDETGTPYSVAYDFSASWRLPIQ